MGRFGDDARTAAMWAARTRPCAWAYSTSVMSLTPSPAPCVHPKVCTSSGVPDSFTALAMTRVASGCPPAPSTTNTNPLGATGGLAEVVMVGPGAGTAAQPPSRPRATRPVKVRRDAAGTRSSGKATDGANIVGRRPRAFSKCRAMPRVEFSRFAGTGGRAGTIRANRRSSHASPGAVGTRVEAERLRGARRHHSPGCAVFAERAKVLRCVSDVQMGRLDRGTPVARLHQRVADARGQQIGR